MTKRVVEGVQRASFDAEIKSAGERTLSFTISTSSVDRSGDVIDQSGWKLDNYMKNPVVLWAHDSTQLPVGRAKSIAVEDGKLKAEVEFTPRGEYPFADTVYNLASSGFLNATSVGFQPIKYKYSEERKGGIDFEEQELLEFSIVPVPANPEALMHFQKALGWEEPRTLTLSIPSDEQEIEESNRRKAEERRRAYMRRKRQLDVIKIKGNH